MAFRTIEISNPAEIHIRNSQLTIEQEAGICKIPVEDISHIFCIGPDIRISTKALSILSQNKVLLTTLDERYLPTAMALPFEGNVRQSQLMYLQTDIASSEKEDLWVQIIKKKISNQAKA